MRFTKIAAALFFFLPRLWAMQPVPSISEHWHPVNASGCYSIRSNGSVFSDDGANVQLHLRKNDARCGGGASQSMDGASIRQKTATLSGYVVYDGKPDRILLWIRADAGTTHLAFGNSMFVPGAQLKERRKLEVRMDIPSSTMRLIYGVYISGPGDVGITHLTLTFNEPDKLSSVTSPEAMLDSAFQIVKGNAFNANKLNWATVEPKIRSMASDAKIAADTYPAIKKLLSMLGDNHSFLIDPYVTSSLVTGGQVSSAAIVKLIDGDIGYIRIPGYRGFDEELGRRFADDIQTKIEHLSSKVGKAGWIIDLREDSGGNMWPMLAALEPFLGKVKLGSFVTAANNSEAWYAGRGVLKSSRPTYNFVKSPVAVLIGPRTNSSGEAVTVAFEGRPFTKFFGQSTSGRSTANKEFRLPDGSMINLTTAVDADRIGRRYGGKVLPDVFVSETDSAGDKTLKVALNWLSQIVTNNQ